MKYATLLLWISVICLTAMAQDDKVRIAVFPFASVQPDYRTRAAEIHEMVVETLRERSNIELIDRAKDSFLLRELDYQVREQSMAAPGLVAQGKLSGAQQIIIGTVTDIALEVVGNSTSQNFNQKTAALPVYIATVNFSLQLSDVETGKVISQKNFSSKDTKNNILAVFKGTNTSSTSKEDAILKGIQSCKKYIHAWLSEVYPSAIRIEKIEDRDGHGKPKTVLVSGLDASVRKGAIVAINEIEKFQGADGKQLTRTKQISQLKVVELQGQITVCKVTSGEDLIEDKLKSGAVLEFKVR